MDDEDGDFKPNQNTTNNLNNLFDSNKPTAPGNTSLMYSAPKPPKTDQLNPTRSRSRLDMKISKNVQVYKLTDRKYVGQGTAGITIVGSYELGLYHLIVYKSKNEYLSRSVITPQFSITVSSNNYISFYDDKLENWSVLFSTANDVQEFGKQFAISKFNSQKDVSKVMIFQDLFPIGTIKAKVKDSLNLEFECFSLDMEELVRVGEPTNVTVVLSEKNLYPWHEGLRGISRNSKRIIILPHKLSEPLTDDLPDSSPLVLLVEVLSINAVDRNEHPQEVIAMPMQNLPDLSGLVGDLYQVNSGFLNGSTDVDVRDSKSYTERVLSSLQEKPQKQEESGSRTVNFDEDPVLRFDLNETRGGCHCKDRKTTPEKKSSGQIETDEKGKNENCNELYLLISKVENPEGLSSSPKSQPSKESMNVNESTALIPKVEDANHIDVEEDPSELDESLDSVESLEKCKRKKLPQAKDSLFVTRNYKADVLSRIAKVGQATLPMRGPLVTGPSDREVEVNFQSPKSGIKSASKGMHQLLPVNTYELVSCDQRITGDFRNRNIQEHAVPKWESCFSKQECKTVSGVRVGFQPVYPVMMPQSSSVSVSDGESLEFSAFVEESRNQHNEIKVGLDKLSDKIDQILAQFIKNHEESVYLNAEKFSSEVSKFQILRNEYENLREKVDTQNAKIEEQGNAIEDLMIRNKLTDVTAGNKRDADLIERNATSDREQLEALKFEIESLRTQNRRMKDLIGNLEDVIIEETRGNKSSKGETITRCIADQEEIIEMKLQALQSAEDDRRLLLKKIKILENQSKGETSLEDTKKILNVVYKRIQIHFDPNSSYSGSEIRETVANTIREVTQDYVEYKTRGKGRPEESSIQQHCVIVQSKDSPQFAILELGNIEKLNEFNCNLSDTQDIEVFAGDLKTERTEPSKLSSQGQSISQTTFILEKCSFDEKQGKKMVKITSNAVAQSVMGAVAHKTPTKLIKPPIGHGKQKPESGRQSRSGTRKREKSPGKLKPKPIKSEKLKKDPSCSNNKEENAKLMSPKLSYVIKKEDKECAQISSYNEAIEIVSVDTDKDLSSMYRGCIEERVLEENATTRSSSFDITDLASGLKTILTGNNLKISRDSSSEVTFISSSEGADAISSAKSVVHGIISSLFQDVNPVFTDDILILQDKKGSSPGVSSYSDFASAPSSSAEEEKFSDAISSILPVYLDLNTLDQSAGYYPDTSDAGYDDEQNPAHLLKRWSLPEVSAFPVTVIPAEEGCDFLKFDSPNRSHSAPRTHFR